jgi:hypothetical protein
MMKIKINPGILYSPLSFPLHPPFPYSNTLLSPFPTSSNLTSSHSSSPTSNSFLASLNASSSVHIFLFKNQDIIPPPFFTSSCVAIQYLARSVRCARTPFFAPRLSCCALPIDTSCSPCKKANVCNGGSAAAIGANAEAAIPCGV